MRTRIITTGLLLVCLTGLIMAQNGQDLYQQGFGREQLGDYGGAIKIYERVVRDFAGDRTLVARAKVRLGDSLMKQGQTRGLEVLNDVINNYKDQEGIAASARALVTSRAGWTDFNRSSGGDLRIDTPFTKDPYSFAISPNGKRLVYQASVGGKDQLWLHDLDTRTNEPIAGTEGASDLSFPFWSPNGKSIAFFAHGKLKRVDIEGGPAIVLADAPWNRGGTWSKDDVILFAPFDSGPLYTVPAGGGPKTAIGPDGTVRREFPQFLEDGRRFIYLADTQWSVGNLNSRTSERFLAIPENSAPRDLAAWAVFAPPDRLFQGGLGGFAMADLLNLETLQRRRLVGDRSRVTGAMSGTLLAGKAAFSASADGPIAYRKEVAIQRSLIWYDRQGRRLSTFDLPLGATRDLRLSPDGRTAIFRSSAAGDLLMSKDLFLLKMEPGASPTMFSHGSVGAGGAWSPVWSPDGTQVVLSRGQGANYDLFTQSAKAIDGASLKLWSDEVKFATDWSESFLLYERLSPVTGADILASPVESGEHVPVAATSAMESAGRFSPDGQWIAYQSNAEGRNEVYVQRFPGSPASRLRVSSGGGTSPEWRNDGKELYFLSADNRLMSVRVAMNGQNLILGKPAALFASPLPEDSTYAPSRDGRFLINAPTTGNAPPIYVVSNWSRPTAAPPDSAGPQTEIVLLDRRGNRLRSILTPGQRTVLSLSPDGSRVARFRQGGTLWTIDLDSSAHTQIATGVTSAPAWAPDAKSVVYVANRASGTGLYAVSLDGVSTEKLLYEPVIPRGAGNWAMDGRFMLVGVGTNWSLLPSSGNSRNPLPVFPMGDFGPPRLSPNSQFLAHLAGEGGSAQVWVRRIATPEGEPVVDGMRWRISTEGSVGMVRWRSDGNEIYYLTLDGWVMAVSLTTTPQFKAEPPRQLFRVPREFPVVIANSGIYADVSADGERFVFALPEATPAR